MLKFLEIYREYINKIGEWSCFLIVNGVLKYLMKDVWFFYFECCGVGKFEIMLMKVVVNIEEFVGVMEVNIKVGIFLCF